jgi:1,4-alpha-glucan branching enzyme
MIKKNYSKERQSCRVTFELPPEVNAQTACVCGEFNDWDVLANPMRHRKNGSFTLVIPLKPGRSYRFRYLLDDIRWENDWTADSYVPNVFGSDDSVVQL